METMTVARKIRGGCVPFSRRRHPRRSEVFPSARRERIPPAHPAARASSRAHGTFFRAVTDRFDGCRNFFRAVDRNRATPLRKKL
jgi:hypothetical protein